MGEGLKVASRYEVSEVPEHTPIHDSDSEERPGLVIQEEGENVCIQEEPAE